MSTSCVDTVTAAARRRQRRLHAYLRYARMRVAMALAESTHHTSRGQKNARAGECVRDLLHGEVPGQPTPQPELFEPCEEEPGGSRPPCLGEPRGPQEQVQLRTMAFADVVPMVQILDAPVPRGGEQLGDQLVEVLRKIDTRSSLQAIEVPKIFPDRAPQRTVERRPPQTAEQLVEVPTQPWYVALVLAEKVFSKQEIRRILAWRGWCSWRSSRFSPRTEFSSGCGADRSFSSSPRSSRFSQTESCSVQWSKFSC